MKETIDGVTYDSFEMKTGRDVIPLFDDPQYVYIALRNPDTGVLILCQRQTTSPVFRIVDNLLANSKEWRLCHMWDIEIHQPGYKIIYKQNEPHPVNKKIYTDAEVRYERAKGGLYV